MLIPDGGTAVIGGILLDTESVNISQIPGLGSIPVLGALFRSTQTVKSTSELLFFITARIRPANALEFLSAEPDGDSSRVPDDSRIRNGSGRARGGSPQGTRAVLAPRVVKVA